jgi:AcrR family transcriptional regulator
VKPGLRERKKDARRERIVAAAIDLFEEQGFDAVRVVDVARAADVSPGTVYNYFPTKEDLVFGGSDAFEEALIDALASRPAGETLLHAFRRFSIQPRGALGQSDQAPIRAIARIAKVIAGSATLQMRARQNFDRRTERVAELIVTERGAEATADLAWVIANAMVGVTQAMQNIVHRLAIEDRPVAEIAAMVVGEGSRALDQLEAGLGTWPV